MARFSADQARQLSRWFHDLSVELGNYRFDHWNDLSPTRRKALEDAQWSLLSSSSDMTTLAVNITLDDSEKEFKDLQQATDKAKNTVKTLDNIRTVLQVATALVTLAAAIVSENPSAIIGALQGVIKAIPA